MRLNVIILFYVNVLKLRICLDTQTTRRSATW